MYLLSLCVLIITVSVSHQQIYCVNKCSCDGIDPVLDLETVMGVTDCCESNSASVKGNVNFTNNTVTDCVLCPTLCGTAATCVIDPITTLYSANVTRPATGKLLFTISANYTCPGESSLRLVYSRESSGDNLFTTVGDVSGVVKIVLANPPNEIREYAGVVSVQLYNDTELLAETTVAFDFNVYDAIEPNATEYTATTTNSRVGGLYLFTAGIITPGFTIVYSIKSSIGDPDYISIEVATGCAYTSTTPPPTMLRTYIGVILFSYTSDTDPSLSGIVEVQFTFTIVLPLTTDPSTYDVIFPFPPTIPQDFLVFTITYSFFQGFSLSSFTFDLIDSADILNINHTTGEFSFPLDNTTEVKRYPASGKTDIDINYFSVEMYQDNSNNESVYTGTFKVDYNIFIYDSCGYSVNATPVCENEGECVGSPFGYTCNCAGTGYTGVNCQTNINECIENTTLCSPGECRDTDGNFLCDCTGTGFVGSYCTIVKINEVTTTTTVLTTTVSTTIAGTLAPVEDITHIIGIVAGLLALALILIIVIVIVIVLVSHFRRKTVYSHTKASGQLTDSIEVNLYSTNTPVHSNVSCTNPINKEYPGDMSINAC